MSLPGSARLCAHTGGGSEKRCELGLREGRRRDGGGGEPCAGKGGVRTCRLVTELLVRLELLAAVDSTQVALQMTPRRIGVTHCSVSEVQRRPQTGTCLAGWTR